MTNIRKKIFAWFLRAFDKKNKETYGEIKERLFKGLHGTVLEIGAGTGVNFEYYPKNISLFAIEPNPILAKNLKNRGDNLGLKISVIKGSAEKIHFKNNSFDHVVSTLVLCSVNDAAKSLYEIKRILKIGGKFIFIEHVADKDGTLRRSMQNLAKYTPWRFFSDRCNPNRKTANFIRDAGFRKVKIKSFILPQKGIAFWLIKPHIKGWAVK